MNFPDITEFDFDNYTELSLQRLMVSDRPRTEAFARAIEEVTRPGSTVIDVGTGTGLLAMLAARAGAAKVYGLDRAAIARVAEALVAHNGLADVVEVVRGDATRFEAPKQVDLIVSEWLGHFAFTEAMLESVLECRDRNLKPGGTMLPSGVELVLAPVSSSFLFDDDGPGFWDRTLCGIDFSPLVGAEIRQGFAIKTLVQPEELLAPAQRLVMVDLATCTMADVWKKGTLSFVVEEAGELQGFAGWFVAELSPSIQLDTGPHHPVTHWRQTYFPIQPVELSAGQTVTVEYALARHETESTSMELDLRVKDQRLNFTIT